MALSTQLHAKSFMYSNQAEGQVDFIIIIFLLYKFKLYKDT